MAPTEAAYSPTTVDELKERLDDPRVARALNSILDNADVLALMVTMAEGFMRRGDEVIGATGELVNELKATVEGASNGADPAAVMQGMGEFISAMPETAPAVSRVVRSGALDELTSPALITLLQVVSRSLNQASSDFETNPVQVKGPISMMRALNDDDVSRGLGFTLTVLRALGRGLKDHHPANLHTER